MLVNGTNGGLSERGPGTASRRRGLSDIGHGKCARRLVPRPGRSWRRSVAAEEVAYHLRFRPVRRRSGQRDS